MVASQILNLKPLQKKLLPSLDVPHIFPVQEFDFFDVFGSITLQDPKDIVFPNDVEEFVGTVNGDHQQKIYESLKEETDLKMSMGTEDFEFLKLVGQGAFGKVYQMKKKDTSEIFALKVVRKDKIIEKNQAEDLISERDILAKIDLPFIVHLRCSFQALPCS